MDTHVGDQLGNVNFVPVNDEGNPIIPDDWDDPQYNNDFVKEYGRTINDPALKEADEEFTPYAYDDTYLHIELALPRNGTEVAFGRVVKKLRDKDGLPTGTAHDNPILDTRMYEVEFQDGHKASNTIAENLFAQIDDEGD